MFPLTIGGVWLLAPILDEGDLLTAASAMEVAELSLLVHARTQNAQRVEFVVGEVHHATHLQRVSVVVGHDHVPQGLHV